MKRLRQGGATRLRLAATLLLVAVLAFVLGWGFRAYLSADAVLGFSSRYLLCN